jgi:hypothetical protein
MSRQGTTHLLKVLFVSKKLIEKIYVKLSQKIKPSHLVKPSQRKYQAKPKKISSQANIKPSQFQAKLNQAKLLNFRHDQAKLNPSLQNWLTLARSTLGERVVFDPNLKLYLLYN